MVLQYENMAQGKSNVGKLNYQALCSVALLYFEHMDERAGVF